MNIPETPKFETIALWLLRFALLGAYVLLSVYEKDAAAIGCITALMVTLVWGREI